MDGSGACPERPSSHRPETFVYRDLSSELANKMTGEYTVALVGDVLMQEPMGLRVSPEILDVLQDADTTIGNMETFIVDRRSWAGRRLRQQLGSRGGRVRLG